MCGLFGVAKKGGVDCATIERSRVARDVLSHRGPDGAGEWCDDSVYLGHRRLSILDLSEAGRQPMVANGVAVTVNGEIYNFAVLRKELEAAGWCFKSGSDSEVVLHGYQAWGLDGLLGRLEGMYAAVIYDSRSGKVLGFRDRIGIKPFIYHYAGDQLVWASELKAIKSFFSRSTLEIAPEAIIDFLTYRFIPAPRTIFHKVYKLPAASILEFDIHASSLSIRRYWSLSQKNIHISTAQISERLRELLGASVKEQLVSDVPLGVLLSGGIDSSSITAFASEYASNVQSFSIGFKDKERDETPLALCMSKYAGTSHKVKYCKENDMYDFLNLMNRWFDEPFADTSLIPTYQVCSFASKYVKVALSGDGGDELFGGYKWYDRFDWASKKTQMMPLHRPFGISIPNYIPYWRELHLLSFSDPVWRYARIRGSLSANRLDRWKELLGLPVDYDPLWAYREHYCSEASPRRAAQLIDFHVFLPDDVLTKVDRVSMAVSLECRPPMLSTDLVEFAFSLPETFIYMNQMLKGGFKKCLESMLPNEILTHSKQGFGVPRGEWMRDIVGNAGSWQEALVQPYLNGVVPPAS